MRITRPILSKVFILSLTLCILVGSRFASAAPASGGQTYLPLALSWNSQAAPAASGATYYVSKKGNNADGRSWATAWSELNQINWSVIQPGDTILLDGGAPEMVYASSLSVGKSGASGKPIIIRLASDAGRNGKVVIFGGRSTPLPYCGQTGYTYQTAGVRPIGIELGGRAWVTIDGGKWRGITIRGHNQFGINLNSGSSNIAVRNVDISDNGKAYQSGGSWNPDLPGVNLSGTNIVFERAILSNNGQDGMQSGGGVANLTIRESVFENTRKAPDGSPWNYCRHPDGIQLYGGGQQRGVLIEDSIFGPGWMQGVMLGGGGNSADPINTWAVIHDVTIRNSLFLDAGSASINTNSVNIKPTNWKLDHVTSWRPNGATWHNLYIEGTGHTITNSILQGGRALTFPEAMPANSANCRWEITGGRLFGDNVNPLFANAAAGNFALNAGSPCAGRGSRVTSTAQLLALPSTMEVPPPPAPTQTPVPTQPPTQTPAPTQPPTQTPAPTQPPTSNLAWEAEAGAIASPFVVDNGSVLQSVETTEPSQGGRAAYRFTLAAPGQYVVKALVNAPDGAANSLFLNIDGEPTSPGMIWDLANTSGFAEQVVSWRGGGTPTANEFAPKVFSLAAGEHELIVRGREANLRIDRISLVPYSAK